MTYVMADVNKTLQNVNNRFADDCQDMEKILSLVVKRRKTTPTKCMEINRQISALEFFRLENAKIVTRENEEKDKFRKIIQGFRRSKCFQFTLHDLHEAEQKLEKYFKQTKEINTYLEKRKIP